MAVEERKVLRLVVRWDVPEEWQALVERREWVALEFREGEEFLWRWAAR
jgi:hypothetical protein